MSPHLEQKGREIISAMLNESIELLSISLNDQAKDLEQQMLALAPLAVVAKNYAIIHNEPMLDVLRVAITEAFNRTGDQA